MKLKITPRFHYMVIAIIAYLKLKVFVMIFFTEFNRRRSKTKVIADLQTNIFSNEIFILLKESKV